MDEIRAKYDILPVQQEGEALKLVQHTDPMMESLIQLEMAKLLRGLAIVSLRARGYPI